jgi:hypothetical protein
MAGQFADVRLLGPFVLSIDTVNDEVVDGQPGAYALGYTDHAGRFCIMFVGSSHVNLRAKLKEHIGTALQFKYRHLPTDRASFEKECELFHEFRPSGNFLHPSRPAGENWTCPSCRTIRFSR